MTMAPPPAVNAGGRQAQRFPDPVEEDVLQLEVLRGVDERPSRESNRGLRIDWSEPPVPYADDAPSGDMMQRYSCGKRAIYRQRRMMGISLRSSGNPVSGRSLTLAGSPGAAGGRRGTPRWLEAGGALACAQLASVPGDEGAAADHDDHQPFLAQQGHGLLGGHVTDAVLLGDRLQRRQP
jgi:hypothetical protein